MKLMTSLIRLFIGMVIFSSFHADASPVPQSKKLSQSIAQAKAIVEVRLQQYTSDPQYENKPDSTGIHIGLQAFIDLNSLKLPGAYVFQVIQTIKGQCNGTLRITLPYMLSYYYGEASLRIEPGEDALLLLQQDASGDWIPIDSTIPIIPLLKSMPLLPTTADMTVQSCVVYLMLASISDPTLRQANTYLLRNIIDVQIPAGLVAYLEDPNIKIQDNVLYCLATNQQVIVIPRIAKLAAQMWLNGQGPQAIQALKEFKTPEAVPYLNPLLFDTVYFTRLNAMFAVDNLADQSSIPYLILALRDPDPQKIIPSSAYGVLHHLLPKLGRSQSSDYFYAHRDEETRRLYDWWNDELEGKHSPKPIAKIAMPDTVIGLNPLLFSASQDIRQAAVSQLEKVADVTSIPYLMLALQDPDKSIAYGAYKTLHRLIPALGAASDEGTFVANRELESQPVYGWWHDELMGRHLQSDYWKKYWRNQPKTAN